MIGEVEEMRTVYSGRQSRCRFQRLVLTRVTLETQPDMGEPTVPRGYTGLSTDHMFHRNSREHRALWLAHSEEIPRN